MAGLFSTIINVSALTQPSSFTCQVTCFRLIYSILAFCSASSRCFDHLGRVQHPHWVSSFLDCQITGGKVKGGRLRPTPGQCLGEGAKVEGLVEQPQEVIWDCYPGTARSGSWEKKLANQEASRASQDRSSASLAEGLFQTIDENARIAEVAATFVATQVVEETRTWKPSRRMLLKLELEPTPSDLRTTRPKLLGPILSWTWVT